MGTNSFICARCSNAVAKLHALCASCLAQRAAADTRRSAQLPDEWRDDGPACAGMDSEIFFTARGEQEALATCSCCAVREPCLELGLTVGFGVFGGATALERHTKRERAS